MKIYKYKETGEYVGEGVADVDPLEPTQWLLPALSTAEKPPAIPAGKRAYYVGGVWTLQDIPAEPKQTAAELRKIEIAGDLSRIDADTIRPARAVALKLSSNAQADARDLEKLATLEAQAAALRAELRGL